MTLLSLLIPTTPDRSELLFRLVKEIDRQRLEYGVMNEVEVLIKETEPAASNPADLSLTTGAKRNWLIENCQGKYYAFIDSDDMIAPNYLALVWPGIIGAFDCCSLIGSIYFNGKKGKPFLHSIKYKEWWEDDQYYYRCVNHLNVVKKELVKDIKFPETNFGEDGNQSYAMRDAGVLKKEYEVKEVLYHYFVGSPKNEVV